MLLMIPLWDGHLLQFMVKVIVAVGLIPWFFTLECFVFPVHHVALSELELHCWLLVLFCLDSLVSVQPTLKGHPLWV